MYHLLSLTIVGLLFSYTNALSRDEQLTEYIANSTTEFTVNLFKQFYQSSRQDGNVIFSPINLYSSLALLHLGSSSQTRSELAQLLKFSNDDNRSQQTHAILSQLIQTIKNTTRLKSNNWQNQEKSFNNIKFAEGIFAQNGLKLNPSFVSQVESLYRAKISNLDFYNESNEATDVINRYISKKTKGTIPQIFSKPIKRNTSIILASALYFKGIWKEHFPKQDTKDANFNTGSKNITVKMMSNVADVPYLNLPSLKAQVIRLPYIENQVSMSFILPDVDQSLDNLIQSLDAEILLDIFQKSEHTEVRFEIPKMKIRWSQNIESQLKELGVQQLFTNNADLSNMIETNLPTAVSKIVHVTDMEVDEKGTEASAATIIHVEELLLKFHRVSFVVDRPFLFFIHNHATNSILFFGSVKNPNGD